MSLLAARKVGDFLRRLIRAFIRPVLSALLVRYADRSLINKILIGDPLFRNRVLSCLDELTRDTCLELYVYHPDLDVLVWKPSLTRLFLTLKEELFLPGNIASDSDDWMRALDNLDLKPNIVFDVGVNSGHTTAWFAGRAMSVYSFEPNEDNVARIRQLKTIRNMSNIEVITSAVSNQVGYATLYLKSFYGLHSLADIGSGRTIGMVEVPTTTIDRFCSEHRIERISILKIDVEGFELEVLQGAASLLKNKMIDLVLFEYIPVFYKQRDISPRNILLFLLDMGYELFEITGNPVDIKVVENYEQADLLAFPAASEPLKSRVTNQVS